MKQFKRPKDQLIEPGDDAFIDDQDVEGHSLPVPAPPSLAPDRPGTGGDIVATDDDGDDPGPSHVR